jgi:hypothetical protein
LKYLAQRAMMSYGSDGTGVTTDIDSYIIHTPCCGGIVIKGKSTRLRIQEEQTSTKSLKAARRKKKERS